MKNKKWLALLLVMVMTTLSVVGCGGGSDADDETTSSENTESTDESGDAEDVTYVASGETIYFAMHPGNGAVAAYLAIQNGYFEELGLDIEVVMFTNGVLINEGFAAGEVEVGINGFASAYAFATGEYEYLGDINAQTEYGVYVNPDSDLVSVQGEVDGLPDVYGNAELATGLEILATQGTVCQIVTDAYMAKLGVSITDYEIIGMDASSALTALLAGEADAAGLYPPYSTQALDAGYVRAASWEDVCGCIPADVLMCTDEFLETNYDDMVLITQAIYKAAAELEADEDLYYETAMTYFGENGIEYSDSDMRALVESSFFYDEYYLTEEGYQFGYHESFAARNLIDLGLLTEDAMDYVKESVNTDVLEAATGISVTVGYCE
ncbi:MAG: ABC transporter substrate-binding protein [Eubacteriales bacterium]